jgi:hypothetical protein
MRTIMSETAKLLIKEALLTQNPEIFLVGVIRVCKMTGIETENLERCIKEDNRINHDTFKKHIELIKKNIPRE